MVSATVFHSFPEKSNAFSCWIQTKNTCQLSSENARVHSADIHQFLHNAIQIVQIFDDLKNFQFVLKFWDVLIFSYFGASVLSKFEQF